jgi:hypothetical protein
MLVYCTVKKTGRVGGGHEVYEGGMVHLLGRGRFPTIVVLWEKRRMRDCYGSLGKRISLTVTIRLLVKRILFWILG